MRNAETALPREKAGLFFFCKHVVSLKIIHTFALALHILISIRGDLRTEDTYNRNINNYPAMGVVCESHNCICRKEYVESSPKAGFFNIISYALY